MKTFGPKRSAGYWAESLVAVPVRELCAWCDEPIAEDESGVILPDLSDPPIERPYHDECLVRSIAGSAAHQLRECSCYGGTRKGRAPGQTRRQAAREAHELFLLRFGS